MNPDDGDLLACSMKKDGTLDCKAMPDPSGFTMPALPARAAWIVVIVAFALLVIAAVLNHVIYSLPSTAMFVFPFFGGIEIARGTLYDISLFLFVGSTLLVAVAFALAARRKTKIVVVDHGH
jgi:hypothetical protein